MKKKYYILIGILLLPLSAITSQAATITVTTLSDGAGVAGSLRERIAIANAGDTIVFQAGLSGQISLIDQIVINKTLIINGHGANVIRLSGLDSWRVLNVSAGNVQMSGLRITQGFASGAGGGVLVDGGNLTLNNCQINGNNAESGGGAIVFTGSSFTITKSTINGNTSAVEGGAYESGVIPAIFGKITYVNTGANYEIYSMNPNGSNQTNLTNNTAIDSNPKWSPDGSKIVFVSDRLSFGTTEIYTMNANGSNPTRLTNNAFVEETPAWSPDGTKLIYQNNSFVLFTINADGTNQTSLNVSGRLPAWGGFNTPTGANVSSIAGTSSITFSNVSISGTTLAAPIDPATAGTLPGGYSLGANFPAYEITTTAVYTAPITVCLQVPGVTDATIFNALTLFHQEGGILIDRTVSRTFATKTICASVTSLSPFVVAQNLAPSAANVSVGGRVLTSGGRGISRALVSIADQNGEIRAAITNAFGFYRFDEIRAGQSYVISAFHKQFQFNSQIISVSEDILNANFTALQ